MKQLGLIVATTEGKLIENKPLVSQINAADVPVVIVNQRFDRTIPKDVFHDRVHVIETQERGLSKSRNVALEHLNARFAMLCDDDIELQPGCLEELTPMLDPDIALYLTPLHTTEGKPWRSDYAAQAFTMQGATLKNRMRIQSMCSMELIVNKEFLDAHRLRFDPDFGVGSGGCVLGEETLLAHAILQAGGVIKYLPMPTRIHPPVSSFTDMTPDNVQAIAKIHRITLAPLGRLIHLLFRIKLLLKNGLQ